MNLKSFTGPGSTPSRRRFWDKVTQAVIASQKVAGRFVTTDEHPGKGTVINVADNRRPTPSGECPSCPSEESITVEFTGVDICAGCIVTDDFTGNFVINSGTLNGTFELSDIVELPDNACCYRLPLPDPFILTLNVTSYFDDECTDPDATFDAPVQIWAGRFPTPSESGECQWVVFASVETGASSLLLFLSNPQLSFSDPFSNIAVCGGGSGTAPHACNVLDWSAVAGESGTATLTV